MNSSDLVELQAQINKVILLLENDYINNPRPMFSLLLKKYNQAKDAIENHEPNSLKKALSQLSGGTRAYLEASSNYLMNPVLEEMYKVETVVENLFG